VAASIVTRLLPFDFDIFQCKWWRRWSWWKAKAKRQQ